jgi:HK97 gp10 family phage protein
VGGFSIKVEGFKELDAKLAALGGKAATNVVRDGLRAGGEVIQAAIRDLAPVRPDLPSGTALPPGALARDIELHIGEEDGKPAAIIYPGTETAYAANWVEYGHRMVKGGYSKVTKSGRVRGPGRLVMTVWFEKNVPAHPFIRPGFEMSTNAAVERAREVILEGIEEAAEK